MSDPCARLRAERKEMIMHRAKITALSQYSGEQVHIVEVEGHTFYATVVGTVKGITLAGAVVTALEIEEVSA
jgi:hypothetical protein